ncbi:hypothetical protein SLA2020_447620 [Shorea laevis]
MAEIQEVLMAESEGFTNAETERVTAKAGWGTQEWRQLHNETLGIPNSIYGGGPNPVCGFGYIGLGNETTKGLSLSSKILSGLKGVDIRANGPREAVLPTSDSAIPQGAAGVSTNVPEVTNSEDNTVKVSGSIKMNVKGSKK